MDAHEASQLVLDWQDSHLVMAADDSVVLGTGDDVDFNVEREYASRNHVRIERRNQFFVLVDNSTNGTFVQTEDERLTFVRRGELRLWGDGWIGLGEPLTPQTAVRFRHT